MAIATALLLLRRPRGRIANDHLAAALRMTAFPTGFGEIAFAEFLEE